MPKTSSMQPSAPTRPRPEATTPSGAFHVADQVHGLLQTMVNCFFVGPQNAGDRQWALVDAAMSWSAGSIRHVAAELFGRQSRPAAIILTHGHFDHVGSVERLARQWDAPIYAHELEIPYLTGRSSYPPPDPSVGGGVAFLSRFLPRGPIDLSGRVHTLPADGTVPGMPGWRWIPTPGHAPGHVSLFREQDRVLLAGDAFVTQRQETLWGVLTRWPEVRRPPAYFTPDWEQARQSVQRLAALRPETAATGHGRPLHGEPLRRGLANLLERWNEVALPAHGRYIHQAAETNEGGFVSAPPPAMDRQVLALLGIGVAVGAAVLLSRRPSGRDMR